MTTIIKKEVVQYKSIYQDLLVGILYLLELLLIIRILMKLVGADAENKIISALYKVTEIIILPFKYLIGDIEIVGNRSNMVFEGSTLLSIIIVGFIISIVAGYYRRKIIINKTVKKTDE